MLEPASSIATHWVQRGTKSVQGLQLCPLVFLKYPNEQVVQVEATVSQISQNWIFSAHATHVLASGIVLGAHLVQVIAEPASSTATQLAQLGTKSVQGEQAAPLSFL